MNPDQPNQARAPDPVAPPREIVVDAVSVRRGSGPDAPAPGGAATRGAPEGLNEMQLQTIRKFRGKMLVAGIVMALIAAGLLYAGLVTELLILSAIFLLAASFAGLIAFIVLMTWKRMGGVFKA